MTFTIFQNEKTPFLAIKTKSSKSRKIEVFPKGLTRGFGPNMAIFPTFFLGNIGSENDFYDTLERKNAFLGYKNKKFKMSKNGSFSKGVNPWFWSKTCHLSNIFFQALQVKKMTFWIFQIKKTPFQAIKTRSSKSQKIEIFPMELTHGFGPNMAFFPTFFLGNIGQENDFYDILEQENAFLGYKNNKFKMSKN